MKGVGEGKKELEYYTKLPYSIMLHQVDDENKKYWIAEIPELPGCTSHGLTIEEAINSIEEAKEDWIQDSLEEGEKIPLPIDRAQYSGKFIVRMSRSLHRALSIMAESEKLSLNQLVVTILAKEVGRLDVLNDVEKKINNLLERINNREYGVSTSVEPMIAIAVNSFPKVQDLPHGYMYKACSQNISNVEEFLVGTASTSECVEVSWYPALSERTDIESCIFSDKLKKVR